MTVKQRLKKLEEKTGPKLETVIRVYYHDKEKGYSAHTSDEYYPTFEAMAKAQGWEIDETDTVIEIQYASQETE